MIESLIDGVRLYEKVLVVIDHPSGYQASALDIKYAGGKSMMLTRNHYVFVKR